MDDIDLLATELISLFSYLIDIEEKQPKPKPRLPRPFERTKEIRSINPSPLLRKEENDVSSPTSANGQWLKGLEREYNHASIPRRHSRLLEWILAPETIYAVRTATLSAALFAVNVSKRTVGAYMLNSGVVALLLGQVG